MWVRMEYHTLHSSIAHFEDSATSYALSLRRPFLLAISEHSAAFDIHQWCITRIHYAIASLSDSRGSPSFVETLPHEVLGHPLILQCVVHDQRVADLLGHPRRNRYQLPFVNGFKAGKASVNVVSS